MLVHSNAPNDHPLHGCVVEDDSIEDIGIFPGFIVTAPAVIMPNVSVGGQTADDTGQVDTVSPTVHCSDFSLFCNLDGNRHVCLFVYRQ